MPNLPYEVSKAWEQKDLPAVFCTSDGSGMPNAIYVSSVSKYSEDTFLVADNYFSKTKTNILNGSRGSLLFITKERKAYQIKGRLERHTSGPCFENMKQWNPAKHPGHAAIALKVEEVYQGATKLL